MRRWQFFHFSKLPTLNPASFFTMHILRIIFTRSALFACVMAIMSLGGTATTAQAQAFPVWTNSGTNWSSSPTNWSPAYGQGQLTWANSGNTTSWNNMGTVAQWRFYFSGNTSYTVGGGNVNFFDWGGQNSGILVGTSAGTSTGNQTINLNVAFLDSGARTAYILTRGSGNLTFGGTVHATNGVTALGIGGSNAASTISFNNTISGNKPVVIGTNSLDGGTNGMGNTRVVFAGNNTYSGETRVVNGILTIAHNNALGATNAGTVVSSGASLRMSNNITVTDEALSLSGALVAGVLRSESGNNAYLGTISLAGGLVSLGAATNASLTISNVSGGTSELWVVGDGTTTVAGGATNSGSGTAFVKTNTGTAILMASNAWTGNKYIREGTVVLSNNNAMGTSGTIVLGAGGTVTSTLQIGSGITNSNAISVESGGTGTRTLSYAANSGTGTQEGSINLANNLEIDVAAGGTLLSSGEISNTGNITKTGAGTATLSGNNSFSGNTEVSGGTLKLDAASGGALAATASVTVDAGAVLLLSRSNQVNDAANVTLSGGTILLDGTVTETVGNLSVTSASFLDFGNALGANLSFGDYTPSSLLMIASFVGLSTLTFTTDLTDYINDTEYFSFSNGFSSAEWDSDTGVFTITAIPEPSAYAAAALLVLMLLWPARRRIPGLRALLG